MQMRGLLLLVVVCVCFQQANALAGPVKWGVKNGNSSAFISTGTIGGSSVAYTNRTTQPLWGAVQYSSDIVPENQTLTFSCVPDVIVGFDLETNATTFSGLEILQYCNNANTFVFFAGTVTQSKCATGFGKTLPGEMWTIKRTGTNFRFFHPNGTQWCNLVVPIVTRTSPMFMAVALNNNVSSVANLTWIGTTCGGDSGAPLHGSSGNCTGASYPEGVSCSLTCDVGYAVSSGSLQRTCTSNGTLSGITAVCGDYNACQSNTCGAGGDSGALCDDAPAPSLDYSCHCSSGYFYDVASHVCQLVVCPGNDTAPEHGTAGNCSQPFNYGQSCAVTCESGWTTPNPLRSCLSDGTLTPLPVCQRVTCAASTLAPTNGTAGSCDDGSIEYPQQCSLQCLPGYGTTDSLVRTCGLDGQLSPITAVCHLLPTCTDGSQNGDETGVDCGGSCEACVCGFRIGGDPYSSLAGGACTEQSTVVNLIPLRDGLLTAVRINWLKPVPQRDISHERIRLKVLQGATTGPVPLVDVRTEVVLDVAVGTPAGPAEYVLSQPLQVYSGELVGVSVGSALIRTVASGDESSAPAGLVGQIAGASGGWDYTHRTALFDALVVVC